jgi:phosphoribosylformimino-5-aminoimidazole carboxamide ribotide isomerase
VKKLLEPRAAKLQGAIAGRALYDGRLDATEALRMVRAARVG